MVQGFIKLFEEKVKIRCLQKDFEIVQSVIPLAVKEFQQIIKKELNREFKLKVELDRDRALTERVLEDNNNIQVQDYDIENYRKDVISKSEDDKKCFGGIIITNDDGKIVFKNTLDVRVDLCFQDSLPLIRETMFPDPNMKNPEAKVLLQ